MRTRWLPRKRGDNSGHFGHAIWCRWWRRDIMAPHQTNYTSRADGGRNGIDFVCGMDARNGVVASFADAGRHDDRKNENGWRQERPCCQWSRRAAIEPHGPPALTWDDVALEATFNGCKSLRKGLRLTFVSATRTGAGDGVDGWTPRRTLQSLGQKRTH